MAVFNRFLPDKNTVIGNGVSGEAIETSNDDDFPYLPAVGGSDSNAHTCRDLVRPNLQSHNLVPRDADNAPAPITALSGEDCRVESVRQDPEDILTTRKSLHRLNRGCCSQGRSKRVPEEVFLVSARG
ncbi:unnamed protein product [Protopolystoma xenopodis]|uniref:Uncharacterized protein n=1 Tax=Protopolystoma xenopodis TaxID=117903 RepID=A0A448X287_9PLAT|nr:unnamed protein product [Protopolystoma xenopodis]